MCICIKNLKKVNKLIFNYLKNIKRYFGLLLLIGVVFTQSSRDCSNYSNSDECREAGCAWDDEEGCFRPDEEGEWEFECGDIDNSIECEAVGCEWEGSPNMPGGQCIEGDQWQDECMYFESEDECREAGCSWDLEYGCYRSDEDGSDGGEADFCRDLSQDECSEAEDCEWMIEIVVEDGVVEYIEYCGYNNLNPCNYLNEEECSDTLDCFWSEWGFCEVVDCEGDDCENSEDDCDADLVCGEAITCCDGVLYPTTCCERNCDEPISECEDTGNDECEDGDMNYEDPCMPMECFDGEWSIILVIDCAEEMGVPCEGGYYEPPSEGECCSVCIENDCDADLVCGEAITCCEGLLYPTTCCERNCDEPISECEDTGNGECEDGEMNYDNPCNPMECWDGQWVEIVIDCAEQMGVPCEGGYYEPPAAGECCSTCVEYASGDVNGDQLVNVVDIVMVVNMILEGDFYSAGDVNSDGQLNVVDIVSMVNIVLGSARENTFDSSTRAALNGCMLNFEGSVGAFQASGELVSNLNGQDLMMMDNGKVVVFNLNGLLDTKSFTFSSVPSDLIIASSNGEVVEISSMLPGSFRLNEVYPNPFNPSTNISYAIDVNSYVNISIYDIAGKKIDELVNTKQYIGNYNINWNAGSNPSGIYFVKLFANEQTAIQKIILIK